MTRWDKDVSPDNVWAEYPRPQMVRPEWANLNGLWQYVIRGEHAGKPVRWGVAVDAAGRVVVALEDGRILCFGRKPVAVAGR